MQGRQLAEAVGQVLRSMRRATGVSQEELSVRAALHRTYPSLLARALAI